jgi:5'-nucleotidase (lipoprotein e(P4) family)
MNIFRVKRFHHYYIIIPAILFSFLVNGCSTTHKVISSKSVNENAHLLNQNVLAVLWYQRSAEVRALYYQAFNVAHNRLDEILKNDTTGMKKAVVVDIDETVLNNSPYQAMNIVDTVSYPTGWNQWTSAAQAKATPGSVSFLSYAVDHGIDVYYVTNRGIDEEGGTLKNLKELGFPQAEKSHLLMKTSTSDKTKRRKSIEKTHKIVLLCGDNLGDFSQIFQHQSSDQRNILVEQNKSKFGNRFIVLPNPMYGEWEGTTYHYNWGMTAKQKANARIKSLNYYHINDK